MTTLAPYSRALFSCTKLYQTFLFLTHLIYFILFYQLPIIIIKNYISPKPHNKTLAGKDNVGKDPIKRKGDVRIMSKSSNQIMNPNAREAMDRFKMEAASEVGVNLQNGYNGELTSRQAGSIGGQMVKKMIEAYENNLSK